MKGKTFNAGEREEAVIFSSRVVRFRYPIWREIRQASFWFVEPISPSPPSKEKHKRTEQSSELRAHQATTSFEPIAEG